jgi:hypothetical protein
MELRAEIVHDPTHPTRHRDRDHNASRSRSSNVHHHASDYDRAIVSGRFYSRVMVASYGAPVGL